MKRLALPASLAVLALSACPSDPEPEEHSQLCFCETRSSGQADAGAPGAPDSGCEPPTERVCEVV